MKNEVHKTSEVRIKVGLNKDNVPVKMEWKADDGSGTADFQECKAMLLSLFDRESLDTMKIDLWTVDMQVNEMDRFFFQTLRALAETYHKATRNNQLASDMQKFVHYFGEQTEIIPKE